MKLFFIIFFLFPTFTFAQYYSFVQYNTKKGLPQSQVTSITQGNDGYLWVGTFGGLARFNGERFESFGRNNGLLSNRISTLKFIDSLLFIGHSKGISIYDGNTFISIPFKEKNTLAKVTGFAKIDSTLFIATNGKGLLQFNKTTQELLPVKSPISQIRSIYQHKKRLVLATKNGIYCYYDSTFHQIEGTEGISFSGLSLSNDTIYASSYNGNVYNFSFHSLSLNHYYENPNYTFRAICIDSKNQKWLFSRDGIVVVSSSDSLELTTNTGLPINDINVLFEDEAKNIWIGTNGKGLLRFTGKTFTHYSTKHSFPSDFIIAVEQDKNGNKWISTIDDGILKIDSLGKVTKIDAITNVVWDIEATDKFIAFASDYGLYINNYNQFNFYSTTDSLPSNRIKGIYFTSDYQVLVGTSEGIVLFDLQKGELVNSNLPLEDVLSARDFTYYSSTFYIASPNGLYILDDDTLRLFPFTSNVNCVEKDNNNNIWIGTENGLVIYNDNKFSQFQLSKENNIEFINFIQHYDTVMFIGTNNGLYEVGTSLKYTYHYGIQSGLINLETNLNSNYVERDNYLWFGTTSGLVRMDLQLRKQLKSYLPPQIALTGVLVNNSPFLYDNAKAKNQLVLSYANRNITFQFDGIFLEDYNDLSYQYKLVGYSNKWSPPSTNPSVILTNLPFGEFEFQFRAITKYSSSSIITIPIKILPPFYRTWWFYLLLGLLGIGIILFVERVRMSRLKIKNRQLKLEFQNRLSMLEQQSLNSSMNRHFIFNALNSIQFYINSSDTRSANKYLTKFAKLIRMNLDSSDHKGGMVSLAEELNRLELYLEIESMRFQERFDFFIKVDSYIETEVLKVPAMFLQPFVENSIIHGILPLQLKRKGIIEVSVTDHLNYIQIKIQDNGVGIDNSKKQKNPDDTNHKSQGMLIAKNRIDLLQEIAEQSIKMISPRQINEDNGSVNGTVVVFKILKQYLV